MRFAILLLLTLGISIGTMANELGDSSNITAPYEPPEAPAEDEFKIPRYLQEELRAQKFLPAGRSTPDLVQKNLCPGKPQGAAFLVFWGDQVILNDLPYIPDASKGTSFGYTFDLADDVGDSAANRKSQNNKTTQLRRNKNLDSITKSSCQTTISKKQIKVTDTLIKIKLTQTKSCPGKPTETTHSLLDLQQKGGGQRTYWVMRANVYNPDLKKQITCEYASRTAR
ncbi:MAG: hypothetical protein M9899_04535 [Bdellovibrionaceae bacterium]|nr:hypothetical protein [Pseudobdellovibrionaceae bacterium]